MFHILFLYSKHISLINSFFQQILVAGTVLGTGIDNDQNGPQNLKTHEANNILMIVCWIVYVLLDCNECAMEQNKA